MDVFTNLSTSGYKEEKRDTFQYLILSKLLGKKKKKKEGKKEERKEEKREVRRETKLYEDNKEFICMLLEFLKGLLILKIW